MNLQKHYCTKWGLGKHKTKPTSLPKKAQICLTPESLSSSNVASKEGSAQCGQRGSQQVSKRNASALGLWGLQPACASQKQLHSLHLQVFPEPGHWGHGSCQWADPLHSTPRNPHSVAATSFFLDLLWTEGRLQLLVTAWKGTPKPANYPGSKQFRNSLMQGCVLRWVCNHAWSSDKSFAIGGKSIRTERVQIESHIIFQLLSICSTQMAQFVSFGRLFPLLSKNRTLCRLCRPARISNAQQWSIRMIIHDPVQNELRGRRRAPWICHGSCMQIEDNSDANLARILRDWKSQAWIHVRCWVSGRRRAFVSRDQSYLDAWCSRRFWHILTRLISTLSTNKIQAQ